MACTAFVSLGGWDVDGAGRDRPVWEYMLVVEDETGHRELADMGEFTARGPLGARALEALLDQALEGSGWRRARGAVWRPHEGWHAVEVERRG